MTYWLTPHAAKMMVERSFTRDQVLACAAHPEQSYPATRDKRGRSVSDWADRRCHQRGDMAVIVDIVSKVVVTVLFREEELWGKSAEREHMRKAYGRTKAIRRKIRRTYQTQQGAPS